MKNFEFITIMQNEDFIVRDHRVHSVRIMPGVTFIDMLYRILLFEGYDTNKIELKNLLFKEPVSTSEKYDAQIKITLEPSKDIGKITACTQRIKNDKIISEEWIENFTCELHYEHKPLNKAINIGVLKNNASKILDMDELYGHVRSVEISHYEFMKADGKIYMTDDYLLAEISLSDLAKKYIDNFYIHPAYLDSSTLLPFLFHQASLKEPKPFIPLFIESFKAKGRLENICYAYITRDETTAVSDDIKHHSYGLYNEKGECIAYFTKLTAKQIRSKELITKLQMLDSIYPEKIKEPPVKEETIEIQDNEPPSEKNLAEQIEDDLCGIISKIQNKPKNQIDKETGFYDQGLDSRKLLEIVKELEAKIGEQLYPTLLFEYTNIKQLAAYLLEEHGSKYKVSKAPERKIEPPKKREIIAIKQESKDDDIAIIGIAGRYPNSPDLETFWKNIFQGKECTSEIPNDHWNFLPYFEKGGQTPNKTYSKWGGFIIDADKFDPLFFSISPREAELMDPQVRVLMETTWHAVEDAGYSIKDLNKYTVGLYAGVMNDDFTWLSAEHYGKTGQYLSPGCYAHDISNRISYALNLQGPSLTIETACSSSLSAIHIARKALLNGECDMALAGGVNLSLHQSKYIMLSSMNIISPDGKEKTFDEKADGYVPGEGSGMVLLKPLKQAIKDGDNIYGVIKSTSINHSGKGAGHHVPNIKAIEKAITTSIIESGIDASQIDYVETHGTGTAIGDPIEIKALENAFSSLTDKKNFCSLGSKANIGHLESASGICSLTKILLSIKNNYIPKCTNINKINPSINLDNSPFFIPTSPTRWEQQNVPRYAAINNFGVGGANAFAVIEEYLPEEINNIENPPYLFILSAKKEERLKKYAEAMADFLTANDVSLINMAYTLMIGREAMKERLAIIFSDKNELIQKLNNYINGNIKENIFTSEKIKTSKTDITSKAKNTGVFIDNRDFASLAEIFVSGIDIDWIKLYEGLNLKRTPLPCYPFAKDRYWLSGLSESSIKSASTYPETVFLSNEWEESECKFETEEELKNIFILADKAEFTESLKTAIENKYKGLDIKLTHPTPTLRSGGREKIDRNEEQFPSKIINIVSWENTGINFEEELTKSYYSLLSLTKEILATKPKNNVQMIYAYLTKEGEIRPLHSAISALFKTIALENPKLQFKTVEINSNQSTEKIAEYLINELKADKDKKEVLYKNGKRFTKSLIEFYPPKKDTLSIQKKRVYIITGGIGGLGLIFARFLSQQAKSQIILTGRSSITPEKSEKIKALEQTGSKIFYEQADISNKNDVNRLIQSLKANFGKINGVIHSAGVIRDSFIIKKTEAEISEVLSAKVFGTIYLDEALKSEQMDFFVLFSSISAVFGNPGQCDYSFANSFMDNFSKQRELLRAKNERFGKTISINWPLWAEGGMHVDDFTKDNIKKNFGIIPLQTDSGVLAFEKGLLSDKTNFIALEGEKEKIISAFNAKKAIETVKDETEEEFEEFEEFVEETEEVEQFESKIDEKDLIEKIKQDLAKAISSILKVKENDIDFDENMSEFGFDSITITEFAKIIVEKYNIELTPANLFEYPTINGLSTYLFDEHKNSVTEHYKGKIKLISVKSKKPSIKKRAIKIVNKKQDEIRKISKDIAIIGMSGIMPQSENLDIFWQNLEKGKNLVTEIPKDRWDYLDYYGDPTKEPNKTNIKWGGFMKEVDKFDALFFGISPREAELMDPQQRLFLETVWKTIEDAGYKSQDLSGTKTGLFVGVATLDYNDIIREASDDIKAQAATGMSHSILANRISYLLNLKGPSEPIDTACSSALVAIHRAVEAIQFGNCDFAIAGGVNVMASPSLFIAFSKAGMLSKDGKCKTFDKSANGYARGEGVGAVFLKPLDKAIEDGDFIYGVIKSTSINHGGKANSLTAPNPAAQAEVIIDAVEKAQINPSTISYIEAHGTGTSLGDPIEINALKKAFSELYKKWEIKIPDVPICGISSVKTNIGHLETAAGIAGVLKVLLCMKYKKLPSLLHFKELNPYISIKDSPFYFIDKIQNWDTIKDENNNPIPRRAGISSFGFGGVNSHIIIEEYENKSIKEDNTECKESIFVLSAKDEQRLTQYAGDILNYLEKIQDADKYFYDIAYTLQAGRDPMQERLAITADNIDTLKSNLIKYLNKEKSENLFIGSLKSKKDNYDIMVEDEEGKEFIKSLILNKKTNKIAKLWVSGIDIDWNLLHADTKPKRLPLPTYPFAKERFWVKTTKKKIEPSIFYYNLIWNESDYFAHENIENANILIFGKNNQVLESLSPYFKNSKTKIIGEINDKFDFQDFYPTHILYTWGIDNKNAKELDLGIFSVFNLIKALGENAKNIKRIIFIFKYPNAFYEALAGFSKSISLVLPNILFSTISIDELSSLTLAAKELVINKKYYSPEVLYKNSERFIKKAESIDFLETAPQVLREKGVYVITGGAGALGLVFAKYLAEKYKARLILIGRSELSTNKKEIIDELNQNGAEAIYIKADTSDIESMTKAVNTAKSKFGAINGIIHAAGKTSEKIITEKDINEFKQVINPKIDGSVILDEATKNEKLDFFVMFSSTSAVLGDFGQCDYAIGNKFLDAFTLERENKRVQNQRYGKTISINWPLWREGGMHLDDEGEALYLKSSGLAYLETEKGILAFKNILSSNMPNIVVMSGEKNKIDRMLKVDVKHGEPVLEKKIEIEPIAFEETEETDLNKRLEIDIKKIASQIVSIDTVNLDSDENLGNFGFDSILLTEFVNKISDIFKITISPTVFFAHGSIKALREYLHKEFEAQIKEFYKDIKPVKKATTVLKSQSTPATSTLPRTGGRREAYGQTPSDGIAIIGIACVLPMSKDINEYWDNLKNEKNMIEIIPKERWNWEDYFGDPLKESNKTNSKWGGVIPDVDKFDAKFFSISPREAELMDPQQRILLETIWKAIEDAGYKASELSGKKVGVYVGVQFNDYEQILTSSGKLTAQVATGNAHAMLSNRASFFFNFRGPSESINTACSSSLIAVHRGVKSIYADESDIAIAAGVSLMLTPSTLIGASQLGVLSPDGKCKTFDKTANGYVKGEGIAAIILKPLARALEDNDNIYAVIKGSSENHGGKAASLTAPNSKAQAELLVKAYTDAGFLPETITCLELHGTGTALGDPVEVDGIKMAFKELEKIYNKPIKQKNFCGIGSVKTNIGHLEPASGIAGLIKIVLSMKNKMLPASLHLNELNPYINLADTPFYILTKTKNWDRIIDDFGKAIPRRAGVSSFGFGGANAHIAIEEFKKTEKSDSDIENPPYIFVISAKNKDRLKEYAKNLSNFIEKYTDISLSDVAYTLQTGREAMEERIAVVIASKDELIQKLKSFTEDKKDIPELFYGNVKIGQASSSMLVDGREGEEFLKIIIKDKKYSKIAQLWASGVEFDWKILYNKLPNKISLPTYPFAKERHWASETKIAYLTAPKGQQITLHSLVHVNRSTLKEEKFSTYLTGSAFYLTDCSIYGKNIFPSTSFIEMARAAGEFAGERKVSRLSNLMFAPPIVINDDEKQVHISLYPSDGDVEFEIFTETKEDNRKVYCKGSIGYEDSKKIADEIIDIESLKNNSKHQVLKDTLYEVFKTFHVNYADGFKTIKNLYMSDTEIFAFAEIPPQIKENFNEFELHPSIIEASLQAIEYFLYKKTGKASHNFIESIKTLEIISPVKDKIYISIKADNFEKYSVIFADDKGNVCAKISYFSIKSIEFFTKSIDTLKKSADGLIYYNSTWIKSNLELNDTSPSDIKNILIFDENNNIKDMLLSRLNPAPNILVVKPGTEFNASGIDGFCSVSPKKQEDFKSLVKHLKSNNLMPDKILYLWPNSKDEQVPIESSLKLGIYPIFFLSSALIEERNQIEILYFHSNNKPENFAVSGFARTLRMENPKINLKTISIQDKSPVNIVNKAFIEFNNTDVEIKYQDKNRYIKSLKEVKPEYDLNRIIKDNGVYIITGGTGGLGLIFAEHLTKNFKAQIVLASRSDLSSERKYKIAEMKSLFGCELIHVKCDILKSDDVAELIRKTKSIFGKIDGVIHSAGITKDSFIAKKTYNEFNAVISPKIYGTIILYEALKSEKIDFFVSFSSVSGVIGNIAQSDYAYANSFLDNFSEIRSGKILSINWPLWQEGGMDVNEDIAKMIEKTFGMKLLKTEDGLKAFETALSTNHKNLLIIYGNTDRIRKSILEHFPSYDEKPKASEILPIKADESKLIMSLQKDLIKIASKILKLDEIEIDENEDMSNYGFDSVTLLEFAGKIDETYKTTIKPSMFFENPTIAEFSSALYLKFKENILHYYQPSSENIIIPEIMSDDFRDVCIEGVKLKSRYQVRVIKEYQKDVTIEVGKEPIQIIGIKNAATPKISLEELEEYAKGFNQIGISDETKQRLLMDYLSLLMKHEKKMVNLLVETPSKAKLEVIAAGDGAPVLLIPGFAMSSSIWRYQFAALSPKYQVISINMPGHGKSGRIRDLSLRNISEVFKETLDILEIERPIHIVTTSYGGMIGQTFAFKYPESTASLTLSGGFSKINESFFQGLPDKERLEKYSALFLKDIENVAKKSAYHRRNKQKYLNIISESKSVDAISGTGYMEEFYKLNTSDILPFIKAETLIISGKVDAIKQALFDVRSTERLNSMIENSKVVEFYDAGHFPFITHAKKFNEYVIQFIDSVEENLMPGKYSAANVIKLIADYSSGEKNLPTVSDIAKLPFKMFKDFLNK
ncbi:MAG: SDR family NAD(P)-dependent oxidoreductase [Desulfobacterales bacterium]|nr:SDR family NAD(P)-dependent oxidoreductase [Desulfobacterales bacterium]